MNDYVKTFSMILYLIYVYVLFSDLESNFSDTRFAQNLMLFLVFSVVVYFIIC